MRIFTIEEANSLVPLLEKNFQKIFEINNQIKFVSKDVDNLISIWGNEIFEKKNVDHDYYVEKIKQRDLLIKELQEEVERIQGMGAVVKDLDIGLVDFYYDNYGELVFLCWKFGEKEIIHWHPVSQGFRNRRSIDELFAIRRRTE